MVQLPEKKGEKRETKRKSSDDNQGKIKRSRATYDLEQKERWCKPCRMKKKGVTCYLYFITNIPILFMNYLFRTLVKFYKPKILSSVQVH